MSIKPSFKNLEVKAGGTVNLPANSISTAALGVSAIQYAEVTLTAAEILALETTPIELVAAPGAGKVLEFISAALFLDHAGTGFTETADNLQVSYENEAGVKASQVIEMTGFINATADTMTIGLAKNDVIAAATGCVNKALVIANINDAFADGGTTTSVLRIKTAYRVHNTGF